MKSLQGMAIASMVASMFAATGCGKGTESDNSNLGSNEQAIVKCAGINSCAGTGACAGAFADGGTHDCAGKNSCAGQGWIEVSAKECAEKRGNVIK